MQICEHLEIENIFLNKKLDDKDSILRFIADICVQRMVVNDSNLLYDGMKQREQTMSTGVGNGLGFPHTTNPEVKKATIFLIRLATSVDFEALDNLPVDIILSLVIPENQTTLHLRLLARISRLCRNPNFIQSVRESSDTKKLWHLIKKMEETMALP